MADRIWHNFSIDSVLTSLETNLQGLSHREAEARLLKFGPNELVKKKGISPWLIFLEQFKSFLIIILIVAVILSAVLGEIVDAVVILIILLFSAGLGFIQEYRAERVLEALKKMTAPRARVKRNGELLDIPSRGIVPGDIIILNAGDRVPADSRLIEVVNLKTNEASLTGESLPVEKIIEPLPSDLVIGDRRNMIYMGTTVVYGRGFAVVTGTGMNTEFGRIAGMLEEVKSPPTPLQVSLDKMGKWLGMGALFICFILAAAGVVQGQSVLKMFIWSIGLAVAAVPEALPAVVTICLAIGVQRMVKRHVLIRKLPAVETLGCTTVICSDKTGTLTQDQMTVRQIYADDKLIDVTGGGYEPKGELRYKDELLEVIQDSVLDRLLKISSLCNNTNLSLIDGVWSIKGDPTEGALIVLAAKAGLSHIELEQQFPRTGELPFSSERKRMTTIHNIKDSIKQEKFVFTKGGAEIVLNICSYIYINGKIVELKPEDKERILSIVQDMASRALRVLGLAFKFIPADAELKEEVVERDMVFAGLVGMIDPSRKEVIPAIQTCKDAGIKLVMITGDYKLTAESIAKDLGLFKDGISLSGAELDKLTEDEFENIVKKVEVYSRVSPMHKLRIVEKLIQHGHIVAMTGDGINDAPALKRADIGVAMGVTGTDVTKEAAEMVLTDDNFASIVAAVEEGRGIFNNIKRFLAYLITCNIGEILIVAIGVLFSLQLGIPSGMLLLTVVQILYINLATDGLPAIALAAEPIERRVMKRKPRVKGESIFTPDIIKFFAAGGIWSTIICLGVFLMAKKAGKSFLEAQSMCFISLILVQFVNAFNFRSLEESVFKINFFTNKWLIMAIIWELIMLSLIIYLPFLRKLFGTYPLSIRDWVLVVISTLTMVIVLEITKMINRHTRR